MRDRSIIDWVDKTVCIAPHIQKKLESEMDWNGKLHLIRPGVNLEKFTLKKKKTDGYQLGMVLGDMWWPKNHMAGLDIFYSLHKMNPKWRLHIRGQHEGGNEFWKQMYDYYIESRELQGVVTLYGHVEDMNEWYENIDILLHPGMKEAFCYAIGEAMAKGIRPVINNFYGSKDIWPEEYIYDSHQQAVGKVYLRKSEPIKYREYIEDRYSLERMLNEFDNLLGL